MKTDGLGQAGHLAASIEPSSCLGHELLGLLCHLDLARRLWFPEANFFTLAPGGLVLTWTC